MCRIKPFLLVIGLLIQPLLNVTHAQQQLNPRADSLISLLPHLSKADKVNTLIQISRICVLSNVDTALHFSKMAVDQANHLENGQLIGEANNWLGNAYRMKANYQDALKHYQLSVNAWKQVGDPIKLSHGYLNICLVLDAIRQTDALDTNLALAVEQAELITNPEEEMVVYTRIAQIYQSKRALDRALLYALKILDTYQDSSGLIPPDVYRRIASINRDLNNMQQAEEFYLKAYRKATEQGNKVMLNLTCNDLGIIYNELGNVSVAIDYYKQALELSKEMGNRIVMSSVYNNMGLSYSKQGELDKAIEMFKQSKEIIAVIGPKSEYLNVTNNIAKAYLQKGDVQNAERFANMVMQEFSTISNPIFVKETYHILAEIAEQKGRYSDAYRYTKLEMAYNDTVYNIEKNRAAIDIQAKYEAALKDKTIEVLKKDNDIKLLANEKQQSIQRGLVASIALLLVVMLTVLAGTHLVRRKNKQLEVANTKLSESEKSLRDRNEEISTQKEQIDRQNKSIKSSIDYASEIQGAMLPPAYLISATFPESFLLYKPLEIVSGDFYWLASIGHKKICAVADCTGHGVPGALMSMLGMSILAEIVGKLPEQDLHSETIMGALRDRVVASLHQTQDYSSVRDSIDASLVVIDEAERSLEFSGANMPLLMIKEGEPLLVKGDSISAGISIRKDLPFTRHTLSFASGDVLYAFSDGYCDQLGGEKGHKFLTKNLVSFLQSIHKEPMVLQQKLLDDKLTHWQGGYKQIDDVLVMGIRL